MRTLAAVCLALAAAPAGFAAPQVVLSDPNAPLFEIRPLDRRVYVLTLDGDWKAPPQRDGDYSVNIEYPNGAVVEHRPTYDHMFRRGEVQILLIQYQYERNHFRPGDKLTVYVTKRKPGGESDDQEVVSNRLEVAWPFDRDLVRLPPKTRFAEPTPIDAYFPRGQEPAPPPKPAPEPLPPPEEPMKKLAPEK